MKNQFVVRRNSFAIKTFWAEPKGVNVAARLIQIVTPSNIGVGFIRIFSLVLIIIGIKITATEMSSIKAALIVEIKHITQKNFLVLVLNFFVIRKAWPINRQKKILKSYRCR